MELEVVEENGVEGSDELEVEAEFWRIEERIWVVAD